MSTLPTENAAAELSRRAFMASSGLGMIGFAALGARPPGAIAGPFAALGRDDFPIPADKKFDPAWVKSLFARGEPTIYSSTRDELKWIGMPIGGICCGQVYLGGDGRLWHWDIFNLPQSKDWSDTAGPHYARPAPVASPITQGFAIRVTTNDGEQIRSLDSTGFRDIEFCGQYPIGLVRYSDPDCPVRIELEAFSPFCPLDPDDSGLPAVVMRYTVVNTGPAPCEVEIAGYLQNPVCLGTGKEGRGKWVNRLHTAHGAAILECSAAPLSGAEAKPPPARPDIIFADFERGTYDGWTVTGTAFGDKPRRYQPQDLSDIAGYQGDLNAQGQWTVNTHETRSGEDVVKADTHIGTILSRSFTVDRNFISFRIGGGNHPDQTCVNLLIDGAVVRTATGKNSNRMHIHNWDVKDLAGRMAQIQIKDEFSGGWGQIGCDDIVFTDEPREEPYVLENAPDFGGMAICSLDATRTQSATSIAAEQPQWPRDAFSDLGPTDRAVPFGKPAPSDSLRARASLAPGTSTEFTFVIAWFFPNLPTDQLAFIRDIKQLKRHYATRFGSVLDVAKYVLGSIHHIVAKTRLWRDTWYNSTLPHWFLDRTFATVSTAATSTCYRFDNGRFYGWEGTYCCAGTCTHVWQYAQALARVFPQLERSAREMIDFDQEFNDETGLIHYRGEAARSLAIDGQCGTILRAYREHTMCPDSAFLKKVWPRVKKAIELVISRDENQDGILDGEQYNTLDTTWYGRIAWISSLYVAVLRAGEAMGREMRDMDFAGRCAKLAELGSANLVADLFTGEYFVHKTDPAHPEANSTGSGCHADQLLGQTFAHQFDLPRIVPQDASQTALRSLYKYNFAPDIGPYRQFSEKTVKGGRWYAMPGEGGLLLCTWPKGGSDAATGKSGDAWAAQYFNECWTGFEHHVASHMLYEGMVEEGMAITRMLHDRHHASKRNPWNEVECSSHYARAMSAFGTFLGACGYAHHGPRGYLAFAPKLNPENFRAAFTTCEGWGTFEQSRTPTTQTNRITIKWGKLRLHELGLDIPHGAIVRALRLRAADREIAVDQQQDGTRLRLTLRRDAVLAPQESLVAEITLHL